MTGPELEGLKKKLKEEVPSPGLEEALLERFRQHHSGPPQAEQPDLRRLAWLAVAAMLLVAVGTGLYRASPFPSNPVPSETGQLEETVYSDFIPLGDCVSLDCLDRAQLMRVDLPRSSVQYFGISAGNLQFQGERIRADVLVGEDGMARAIRFVY